MEATRELTRAEIGASIDRDIAVFLRTMDLWNTYSAQGLGVVEACQKALAQAEREAGDGTDK
jgi:hypothetical protein